MAEGGDRQSERVPYSIERALLVRRGGCAGFGRCSFVAARNSEVDVVQSVGRVMRTFHKGASDEKKYGYIIVPVVVPADVEPEKAMEDNERFPWSGKS